MTAITLLDGSIGQELVRRAGDAPTPLWSTQTMLDHPHLVRQVNEAYFSAGATVATTNTYAVLEDRLARVGLEARMTDLTQTAVMAARAARDAAGGGRVAGVVGPLIASYRPDIAAGLYDRPVGLLADAGVDLLLLETMSSVAQADGALRAACGRGLPVWLALTVDDADGTCLRSGEPLGAIAPLIDRFAPDALLINCSRPEAIAPALDILGTFGLPFGAYANGFTEISAGFLTDAPTVDALDARTDLGPARYGDAAMGWLAQGATILGGCCEIGPAHIAELARRLTAAGHALQ